MKRIFYSPNSDREEYNHTEVEILKPLSESEAAQVKEKGYWVRFNDGIINIAFESELLAN